MLQCQDDTSPVQFMPCVSLMCPDIEDFSETELYMSIYNVHLIKSIILRIT
jgi:hypothetical protein